LPVHAPVHAQQAPPAPPLEQPAAEAAEPAPLSEEVLDALVAPVALYPDPLLAQVLVAATYPLEIVKASRWVGENEALADDKRADAAEAEGWDPSVAVLAAGFPSVVKRMADDLDATEALGDAVLADTDAVLDAVQRQRARAAAVGNLENNAAQTVTVQGDTISIAPANPQVVYVPAYNPSTVYTQPAPSAPVVVEDPDADYDSGDLLLSGIIGFGAGLLVSEIFDDDDDWGGYWGAPAFGWGGGAIYPRPGRGGIYVDGDVNIDRSRDRVRADGREPWRAEPGRRDEARARVEQRGEPRREGARPETRERDAARDRIGARTEGGARVERPAAGGGAARPAPREAARPAGAGGSGFAGRQEGLSGARAAADRGAVSAARQAPAAANRAAAPRQAAPSRQIAPSRQTAFDRGGDRSGARASAASSRGARSAGGGGGGGGRAGGGGGRGR
jgi:hypothetical protein